RPRGARLRGLVDPDDRRQPVHGSTSGQRRRVVLRRPGRGRIGLAGAGGQRRMSELTVDGARLRSALETLAQFGATPSGGVSRTSFSPADSAARAWVLDRCEAAGLRVRTDGIGNMFVTVPGAPDDARPVWTGSHIDSVPDGGRFDGALGS